jgi:hypothetical protein
MEQFYDVYVNKPKLAPQVRVLAWTHNLMIMGQNKRPEEREFYLMLAVRAKCSSCGLALQIKTAAFERTILSDKKLAALPRLLPQDASGFFKNRREPDNIWHCHARRVGSIWCSCHGAGASSAGGKTGIGRKNGGVWGFAPPSQLVGLCQLGLLFRLGCWLQRGLLAVSALSLAANCYPAERWRSAPGICLRSSPKNS